MTTDLKPRFPTTRTAKQILADIQRNGGDVEATPEALSSVGAARILDLSVVAMNQLATEGRIPYFRAQDGRRRFLLEHVLAYKSRPHASTHVATEPFASPGEHGSRPVPVTTGTSSRPSGGA